VRKKYFSSVSRNEQLVARGREAVCRWDRVALAQSVHTNTVVIVLMGADRNDGYIVVSSDVLYACH
jgi:hypothetical protein